MTDEDFRQLCNTFGFAPSRALREMLDAATKQAVLAEREACAEACERWGETWDMAGADCAATIRARKEKT